MAFPVGFSLNEKEKVPIFGGTGVRYVNKKEEEKVLIMGGTGLRYVNKSSLEKNSKGPF